MIRTQLPAGRQTRVLIAVVLVLIVVRLAMPSGLTGQLVYLVIEFGAAAVAGGAAVGRTGRHRRFAVLLATAILLTATGDLIIYCYVWTTGVEPDASVADLAWIAAYLALAAALYVQFHRDIRGPARDFEGIVDAAVVFVACMLIVWELFVGATLVDVTLPIHVRLVWAIYPILDVVVLTFLVRMSVRRWTRTSVLLAGGVVSWLVADFLYLLFAVQETMTVWLDLGWLLAAVLVAAAAVSGLGTAGHREPAQATTIDEIGLGRVAIALVPMLVPGLIELYAYSQGYDVNPTFMLFGTIVLVGLAFLRMARLTWAARAARRKLMSQERYSAALAANSSDAVVVVDADRRVVVNGDRRVLDDVHRLGAFLGLGDQPLVGADLMSLVAQVDLDRVAACFERCLATPGQVFHVELRVSHAEGRQIWLEARLVNLIADPDVRGIVVNLHDITGRKAIEDELGHQAFHDALTGLANRALFRDRLDHALDRNARTGVDPAVIFLDLDGFKTVNDSLGHDAGDELLGEVATRLLTAVRRGDTVGRLGGDEFAILIEQSNRALDEATTVAERVLQSLTVPVRLGEHHVTLSASLGIAIGDGDGSSADLLRDADVAMYQAKAAGKGRWVVYDPGMRTAALERLELESQLHGALDRGEFRLVYQPVVDLESEHVVGFEALLRWHHPAHGVIPPDRFIPLAEDNGLIVPIGRWVLGEATMTAARWQRRFDHQKITMAVNVSAVQLASPDLVFDVADALTGSGLPPADLVLEMTETVLVKDPAAAAERLHELRRLGVRLAIDDFGTGYSSLSYLRQFPVDILKIDRSFISTITERDRLPAIVRGMLDLGRTLQLETVAEGVELEHQRESLRDEQCLLAQGYLFARPLPADEAELFLADLTLGAVT